MSPLTKDQIDTLTRLGAHARLAELVPEMDAILAAFPDLGSLPARPLSSADGAAKSKAPRTPYRMSAANRKAASQRMKAYRAAKRQTKEPEARPVAVAPKAPRRKKRPAAKQVGKK